MNRIGKSVSFIAFVALLSAGPAFTQSPSDEQTSKPTVTPAPVAHVYVQTASGVNVYDATAAGKLTIVKGSPFATAGQMEGVNGKYLISVGTTNLHSYAAEPDGTIGQQVSMANTQSYAGSACGTTSALGDPNGATLDHTGKYFSVQLWAGYGRLVCAAWQTYQIEPNGELTFLNDVEYQSYIGGYAVASSVPAISSNDDFAYGVFTEASADPAFSTFARAADGVLGINQNFSETGPMANPKGTSAGPWHFYPAISYGSNGLPISLQAADPTGHMAVLLGSESGGYPCEGCGPEYYGPLQLASYTINGVTGAIVSTNTWANMPMPGTGLNIMNMSPRGKLLAVAGHPGLQLFHFNGAAPITTYSPLLLPAVNIDQLAWDNDNHLYALSYSSGELYVYTATPTSIKEVSGSPYKVENAYGVKGLIVVPKL